MQKILKWNHVGVRARLYAFTEGSLEVKLPTIWTEEAAEAGRVREEKRREEHVLLTFDKVHTIPCACHPKRHLNVKKWSEHVVFLTC